MRRVLTRSYIDIDIDIDIHIYIGIGIGPPSRMVVSALLALTLAGCGLNQAGLGGPSGVGGSSPGLDAGAPGEGGAGGAGGDGDDLGAGGQPGSGGRGGGMGIGGDGAGGDSVGAGGAPGGTGGATGIGGAPCQTCAACERCTAAGTCEVDPESHWDLSVVSATLNQTDPYNTPAQGLDWDLDLEPVGGPLPDPFCELDQLVMSSVRVVGQARALTDTVTPNWSTALAPDRPLLHPAGAPIRAGDLMPGGPAWLIWIGDDDGGSLFPSGETMCQIEGPLTAIDFRAGGFVRSNVASCLSATFKLTCHP
ncbi:MAG TPA: hypothetical protein VFH68_10520 [Polyangia bacterium]|jgi:hypothetical protein|nr:hypothetical protein [Polyangia bacterium]